jgi:hypothetical protein
MSLHAFTATARINGIDAHGHDKIITATGADLQNSAYLAAYQTPDVNNDTKVRCEQRVYASRARKHVVVAEFTCTNDGLFPAYFQLGQQALAEPIPYASTTSVSSGIANVACSKSTADVSETPASIKAVVAECHDDNPIGIPQKVKPGATLTVALVSTRCSNIDTGIGADAGGGIDPLECAIAEYRAAHNKSQPAAAAAGRSGLWVEHARCPFSDRNLHSRMPLDPTHVRLK